MRSFRVRGLRAEPEGYLARGCFSAGSATGFTLEEEALAEEDDWANLLAFDRPICI